MNSFRQKAYYRAMHERTIRRRAVKQVTTIAVRIEGRWEALVTCEALFAAQNVARDAVEEYGVQNVQTVWSTAHTVNDAVEKLNR